MTTYLSGYRLLWIFVMFDLPTDTKPQRREATAFRNFLLDEGFERAQFSVYARSVKGKEGVEARTRRVEANLPSGGEVQILSFTDRQYENIVRFSGQGRSAPHKNPEQMVLF